MPSVKEEKKRKREQHTAAKTHDPIVRKRNLNACRSACAHTQAVVLAGSQNFLAKRLNCFFQEPHDMVFAVSSYSHLISVITLALFIPSHFLRRKRPNTLPGKLAILSHTSPILKIVLRENESFNISWYMHSSGTHKTHFLRMKNVNNRDWTCTLHSTLSVPLLPVHQIQTKKPARGHKCTKREQREAGRWAKSPPVCLWVSTSQAGRTRREIPAGQQSALNWPAVQSAVPRPDEKPGLAKKREKDTAVLHRMPRQSLLLRGVPFRIGQQAPGELERPYVLIRAEASASSSVILLWVWSPPFDPHHSKLME